MVVGELLLKELERRKFGDDILFGVRESYNEAASNGVNHGNVSEDATGQRVQTDGVDRPDPRKKLRIYVRVTENSVHVEIGNEYSDVNQSFDPDALLAEADKIDARKLATPSGRGFLIMRHYTHRMGWGEKRNRIVLEWDRNGSKLGAEHKAERLNGTLPKQWGLDDVGVMKDMYQTLSAMNSVQRQTAIRRTVEETLHSKQ